MVTLKPYLDAMRRKSEGSPERAAAAPLPGPWPEFATALVDSVSRHVLDGEPYRDIREDLRLLSESLRSAHQPPSSSTAFDRSIQEFRRRSEDASQTQLNDMRRMLTDMNDALILLAAGSDRTINALRQMELALVQVLTLKDISSLKSKVNEVIRLISQESALERDVSSRAISAMHNQITASKKALQTAPAEYPGREPAVIAMSAASRENIDVAIAVFVLRRLPEIIASCGQDAAGELLHNLIRDSIQPLAPEAQAFAWSADTALLVGPANLKQEFQSKAEVPFERRFVSGGRLVTLKGSFRATVLSLRQPVSQTVCNIDRFVRSAPK